MTDTTTSGMYNSGMITSYDHYFVYVLVLLLHLFNQRAVSICQQFISARLFATMLVWPALRDVISNMRSANMYTNSIIHH
jgi:hypothetical protein